MKIEKEATHVADFDVIVAGGGVSGVAAAVSASRLGKKVLLIEKSMKLGGLATSGLVNLFVPMCNGRGKQIIFGMAEELLRLSLKYGYDSLPDAFENGVISKARLKEYTDAGKRPPRYMSRFSSEIFALSLTELCINEGVELLFDSMIIYASSLGNDRKRIDGVVVENKSGTEYYSARMFVDATGDGVLLDCVKVPTVERENFHTYYGYKISLDSCRRALDAGDIRAVYSTVSGGNASLYGTGHPKNVPLYYATSQKDVNRYIISNQLEMLEKIKNDDRKSRDIAVLPGMAQFRTVRRIDGDYVLTEDDEYRHFEDSVGAICDFDRRDYLFEIPFRALVRKEYGNIIAAGRVACSHAIDENSAISDINIAWLQRELENQNVIIHFDDEDVPEISENIHEYND